MFRFAITVVLAASPVAGFCQADLLTLDECLEIALANNLALVNARLEVAAAGDDVAALRTRRYPRLDLQGGVSGNLQDQGYTFEEGVWGDYPMIGELPAQDVTINSASGSTSFLSAGVTQPLSQQYRLALSIEQGEVREDMAEEMVRLTQQDLIRIVKQQYFDLIQTQSDLATTKESILFYVSLNELVSNYVAQQVSLEYELLEVDARLARRQLGASAQQHRLDTQREQMNDLLARDLNTPFTVQELPDPGVRPTDPQKAVATALSQRPDIIESKLKVKEAELGYDIKKAEYIPALDLRIRYAKLYDYELIPDTEAYVGLHAKWEFYDWGRKKKELASKTSLIRQAANSARETENRVVIDVHKSFRAIDQAEGSVRVAMLSQAASRDKLRVLMNQYEQQSILLQDVLDAETELARANSEYTRAVLSVWKAQAELDHAIGEN
jgi:outer membrane protein TolC